MKQTIVKTQVVSVRVAPQVKHALLRAAESEMRSQANMVEVMVLEYCRAKGINLDESSVKRNLAVTQ